MAVAQGSCNICPEFSYCEQFGTGAVAIDGQITATACVELATWRTNAASVPANKATCDAVVSPTALTCTDPVCKFVLKDDVPTCLETETASPVTADTAACLAITGTALDTTTACSAV